MVRDKQIAFPVWKLSGIDKFKSKRCRMRGNIINRGNGIITVCLGFLSKRLVINSISITNRPSVIGTFFQDIYLVRRGIVAHKLATPLGSPNFLILGFFLD